MKHLPLFVLLALALLLPAVPVQACYGYSYHAPVAVAAVAAVAVVPTYALPPVAVAAAAPVAYAAPAVAVAAAPVAVAALPVVPAAVLATVATYDYQRQLAFFTRTYGVTVGRQLFDRHFGVRGISRHLIPGVGGRRGTVARGPVGRTQRQFARTAANRAVRRR